MKGFGFSTIIRETDSASDAIYKNFRHKNQNQLYQPAWGYIWNKIMFN